MPQGPNDSTEKLMTDIKKDFVVVQKNRVRFVYAYLAIALCLGIGVGIGFVIGQNGDFQAGEAKSVLLKPGVQEIRFGTKGGEVYKIIPAGSVNAKDEGFAVAVKGSKYWYQRGRALSGTNWISYKENDQPPQGTRVQFAIPVSLPAGTSLESKIVILADDTASVTVNGQKVADESSAGPYTQCAKTGITCTRPTTITVPAGVFHSELNTVVVEVLQAGKGKTPFGLDLMGSILMDTNQAGGQPPAQCSDGFDNDVDGKVDAADPGCHLDGNADNAQSYNASLNSELGAGAISVECSNGKDDDGDGLIDAADSGCSGDKGDNDERNDQTGNLTITLSPSTPGSFITEDNKTGVQVAGFSFKATGGNATIQEITLALGGTTTVKKVILKDGSTTLGTKSGAATVTFTGLRVAVANNITKELSVYMDFGTVGSQAGISGENVKAVLDSVTITQGTVYDDDVAANNVYVFAAIPKITKVNINTLPILASAEIYRWTVTPYGGSVTVKEFSFKTPIKDQGKDNTLTLGNFVLYKNGSNITSNVSIVDETGASVKTGAGTLDENESHVYVIFNGEDVLNGAATYSLWATPSGFDAIDDDYFFTEMGTDEYGWAFRYLKDEDYSTGEIIVGVSGSGTPEKGGLPIYMIWSDNSASPHSASVSDAGAAGAAPNSSGDWWSGYLVKDLPLSANTFKY